MTLAELAVALIGIFKPSPDLFNLAIAYGSPPYFILNSLGENRVDFGGNPLLPLLAGFHAVKYLTLARSQFVSERHSLHYLAVIFEIVYLAICFYHL